MSLDRADSFCATACGFAASGKWIERSGKAVKVGRRAVIWRLSSRKPLGLAYARRPARDASKGRERPPRQRIGAHLQRSSVAGFLGRGYRDWISRGLPYAHYTGLSFAQQRGNPLTARLSRRTSRSLPAAKRQCGSPCPRKLQQHLFAPCRIMRYIIRLGTRAGGVRARWGAAPDECPSGDIVVSSCRQLCSRGNAPAPFRGIGNDAGALPRPTWLDSLRSLGVTA